MQNGFSNFDLKRIKPQALMPGAKLRSDNVTALPSVLLQISSQDVLLELANPGQQRGVAINRTFFCYLMSSVIRAQGHTWDWRYLEHRRPGHVQICTGLKIWAAISQCLERFKDSEMLIKYDQVPRFRFIRYIDIFNIFNYHFLARVKQNSSLFHSRLCSQICKKKFWHRWPAPVRKTPWLFWEVRRYTSFDRCKSGKPFYLPMLGEQTCTRSTCAFEHRPIPCTRQTAHKEAPLDPKPWQLGRGDAAFLGSQSPTDHSKQFCISRKRFQHTHHVSENLTFDLDKDAMAIHKHAHIPEIGIGYPSFEHFF